MSGDHPLEMNRAVPGGRVEISELGWHHRHVRFGDDTDIEFHGITTHVVRFLTEIADLTTTGGSNP